VTPTSYAPGSAANTTTAFDGTWIGGPVRNMSAGNALPAMRKECGPITDPELRQSCLASFNQDEPYMGSLALRRVHHSGAGR
jgi:hypothetical protein